MNYVTDDADGIAQECPKPSPHMDFYMAFGHDFMHTPIDVMLLARRLS